ncbi:hypothetical protein Fot_00678 [Forsythia ovata]|uniref:Uncharacterized protein n=1 Tax=Forsythia ovata TaxID=205694 RepID=A0ABD1X1W5_9LAMI
MNITNLHFLHRSKNITTSLFGHHHSIFSVASPSPDLDLLQLPTTKKVTTTTSDNLCHRCCPNLNVFQPHKQNHHKNPIKSTTEYQQIKFETEGIFTWQFRWVPWQKLGFSSSSQLTGK